MYCTDQNQSVIKFRHRNHVLYFGSSDIGIGSNQFSSYKIVGKVKGKNKVFRIIK